MIMAHSLETNDGEGKHLNQEEDGIVLGSNISTFIVFPHAVRSAIELGIFNILAKVGKDVKLSAKDIAVKIGARNPEAPTMLDSLLRLLASHSLLYCSLSHEDQQGFVSPERLYSLAPTCMHFVADADGASFGSFMSVDMHKYLFEISTGLKGAIMEGGIYGMHMFEYARVNPKFNVMFNTAMAHVTTKIMERILEYYQGFGHIKKLVDVGGGNGINLNLITSKYTYIQGINFDLPHVIEHAPTYHGVTHVGGDMFKGVPKGDAIFLKTILHNWDDEHCLKLLKNCYKAIPNDGKVIAVESILPILPDNTIISQLNSQLDLIMMASLPGGRERTQNEFIDLALGSGFSGVKFVICISGFWVMEFFK